MNSVASTCYHILQSIFGMKKYAIDTPHNTQYKQYKVISKSFENPIFPFCAYDL